MKEVEDLGYDGVCVLSMPQGYVRFIGTDAAKHSRNTANFAEKFGDEFVCK